MIFESSDWKESLLRSAIRLRRLKAQPKLTSRNLAQIERDVFIGFYSIRKLFDAPGKITDATRGSPWQCTYHNNVQEVTWRNKDAIDENYDLSKSSRESRDLIFVCGRIIHSFVFGVFIGENGGFDGIFFSSDTDKDKKLYVLSVDMLIEIFERVGNDYPSSVHWTRDPVTGKDIWDVR